MKKKLDIYWQHPETHERFKIGVLSYDGVAYVFSYEGSDEAFQNGFREILPFLDRNKIYKSDNLFLAFSSRLPSENQIGIEKILKKYDLDNYDAFELLARSCGRTPKDTLEFITPIVNNVFCFYVAGVSHGDFCKNHLYTGLALPVGASLIFRCEPDNPFDQNAIAFYYNDNKLGYVPKYYSASLSEIINKGKKLAFSVIENNLKKCDSTNQCRVCVYVKATITD